MKPIPRSRGRMLAIVFVTTFAAVAVSCHKERNEETRQQPRNALPYFPEQSAAETRSHLGSLEWDDTQGRAFEDVLKCDNPMNCGGLDTVRIRITPEARSNVAPVEAALKRSAADQRLGGYIVAKIHNMDKTHPFDGFKLGPDATAYLWAGPTKSLGNRFAIYSIDDDGIATLLAVAQYGTICRRATFAHPEVHIPPPSYGCTSRDPLYGAPNAQQKTSATSSSIYFLASNPVRANVAISMFHTGSLWFSCSGGCCEASDFQIQ